MSKEKHFILGASRVGFVTACRTELVLAADMAFGTFVAWAVTCRKCLDLKTEPIFRLYNRMEKKDGNENFRS